MKSWAFLVLEKRSSRRWTRESGFTARPSARAACGRSWSIWSSPRPWATATPSGPGRCYWENFSNEAEKIQKAAALLDEAAAAGALLDSGLAGRIYDKAGRKEEAARHYRAAAEQGDSWAQFKTGWNYAQGTFLETGLRKGRLLVRKGFGARLCRRQQ